MKKPKHRKHKNILKLTRKVSDYTRMKEPDVADFFFFFFRILNIFVDIMQLKMAHFQDAKPSYPNVRTCYLGWIFFLLCIVLI